jgi:hypothetical protein
MEKKNILTKFLAVAGTILVWFPIAAPVLISAVFFLQEQTWRFDYLMPAELFFSFLLGSGLLLWAALRAHSHVKPVAWGLGMAVLVLFAGQAFAVATGLASGEIEPAGWIWVLVLASLAVYVLGIILVGVGGAMLLRDLFKRQLPAG